MNFTVQMILSSRGASPRRQQSSKVIGVCDSCCNPNGSNPWWLQLKQQVGTLMWMNRNDHRKKLETPDDSTPVDAKTAAAGG